MLTNNSTNQNGSGSLRSLKKLHMYGYAFIPFMLVVLIGFNIYLYKHIEDMQNKYEMIQKSTTASMEANKLVLAKLEEIRDEQVKIQEHQAQMMQIKSEHQATILQLKSNGMSPYDDLGSCTNLTVEDMNKIIDYYASKCGGTPFEGRGEIFIKASQQTGLNPIYIFAHASCESGYGNSYLARTKGNYFGINAVDSNPGAAYHMGDSVEEGIIAGAVWIKRNYYDNGYTTLQSMKDAGYATSDTWVPNINSIANGAINAL